MKKFSLPALCLLLALSLAGCGVSATQDDAQTQAAASPETVGEAEPEQLVLIKEKMFIAQTNEIYVNADDYIGKTIQYEGVFDSYPYNEAGDMFYSVIRYGPGCCGDDGNVGFEVIWDKKYPANNSWVKVNGVLERYDEDGQTYLRLRADTLDVMPKRGNENVSQ